MSSSLKGHLNHQTTAFVAEVMSKWLDDEEINSFIKTIKDWQEKITPGLLHEQHIIMRSERSFFRYKGWGGLFFKKLKGSQKCGPIIKKCL